MNGISFGNGNGNGNDNYLQTRTNLGFVPDNTK
jgi:hypothetical protein